MILHICSPRSGSSERRRLDSGSGQLLGRSAARGGPYSRYRAPVWAFRWSIETIYCLWPTWMVKVLAPLETTR